MNHGGGGILEKNINMKKRKNWFDISF